MGSNSGISGPIVAKNATDRHGWAYKVFFAHTREWKHLIIVQKWLPPLLRQVFTLFKRELVALQSMVSLFLICAAASEVIADLL
jgi:hypothetical protein